MPLSALFVVKIPFPPLFDHWTSITISSEGRFVQPRRPRSAATELMQLSGCRLASVKYICRQNTLQQLQSNVSHCVYMLVVYYFTAVTITLWNRPTNSHPSILCRKMKLVTSSDIFASFYKMCISCHQRSCFVDFAFLKSMIFYSTVNVMSCLCWPVCYFLFSSVIMYTCWFLRGA